MSDAPADGDQPLHLVGCPECEAAVDAQSKRCWLCGHTMDSPFKGTPGQPAQTGKPPKPAAADQSSSTLAGNVSLGAIALVLLMLTAAVWVSDHVQGTLLAVLVLPPLAITLFAGLISRLSGKVMSPARRLVVFLYSVLATLAVSTVLAAIAIIVIAAMVVSMIVALFEACFKMLGG